MSKNTNRSSRRRQRQEHRLRIRSIRRRPPDLKKLAGALIEFAQAQAEADAAAQQALRDGRRRRRDERDGVAEDADDGGGQA